MYKKRLTWLNYWILVTSPYDRFYYCSRFTNEETEAQQSLKNCPWAQIWGMTKLRFEPRLGWLESVLLTNYYSGNPTPKRLRSMDENNEWHRSGVRHGGQNGELESPHSIQGGAGPCSNSQSQLCRNMSRCGQIFHFQREAWNLDFIWNLPTFKCWEPIQTFLEKHCAGKKIGICSPLSGRNSCSPLLMFPVGGTLARLPQAPVFLLWLVSLEKELALLS